MDAILLDLNLNAIKIIDQYESFIWTERYQEYGDFELYLPAIQDVIDAIEPDYYIMNKNSDRLMIIEEVSIVSDIEDGAKLKITGRSLESILMRRIVWKNTVLKGDVSDCIEKLLNDNLINPKNPKRKINGFIFQKNEYLTKYDMEAQYMGDSLYDVINTICVYYDLGFKITIDQSRNFVFSLYEGSNRLFNNTQGNSPVIFSPKFDNLLNSNYVYSNKDLKNATLIGGEGEGADKKFYDYGMASGILRREIYTDSSGLTQNNYDIQLSDDEYKVQLLASGLENLNQYIVTQTFEGEMETTITFKYGYDFYLGDILHIQNEYGIEGAAKVTEFVMSYDSDGYKTYPNFIVEHGGGKVYLNDVGDVTITEPQYGNILRRKNNELWVNRNS